MHNTGQAAKLAHLLKSASLKRKYMNKNDKKICINCMLGSAKLRLRVL